MDVFITHLDSKITRSNLKQSLIPILQPLHIHVFDVRKAVGKTFATLTIADLTKAQSLLAHAWKNPALFCSPSGQRAQFNASRKPVDPLSLRVLQKEEKDQQNPKAWQKVAKRAANVQDNEPGQGLTTTALECGRWETTTAQTTFVSYFECCVDGRLTRDGKALVVKMNTTPRKKHDLVMDLSSIHSLAVSREEASCILMITLLLAPKIIEDEQSELDDDIMEIFAMLRVREMKRFRETTLPGLASVVVGSCLTYRIVIAADYHSFKRRIEAMTSHHIPVTTLLPRSGPPVKGKYSEQLSMLNAQVIKLKCSFAWRFQIHALWANAILSPREVQQLLPAMVDLRARVGEATLIKVLQRLNLQLPPIDAITDAQKGGVRGALNTMTQQAQILLRGDDPETPTRDEVLIHRVTVTPTGVYLYGPEYVAANRVLRQYRAHSDCFLRVFFADENEERIQFDPDLSNERILQGRFLSILRRGLDIAGAHLDFLGFSHSSLRSQTCWFMRPFVNDGSLLLANALIEKLGDFSVIRCPAKCAARIGQAFSETTKAVTIDASTVQVVSDVQTGGYVFTDGCGTVSKPTWRLLKGNTSSVDQPTSYQIRYKGAKGMLTLDTRLKGHQIRLRNSMVKFTGSPSNDLEICGANARALGFKLNRPLIKILEDLNVPGSTFEKLQEQAVQRLRLSACSPEIAVDFVIQQLSDSSSGLPALLKHPWLIDVDVTEDNFFREVLGALLQVQLREIKYRSRIPVADAITLYGISDETGWLDEGHVFVTSVAEESHTHLNGRVAVTRSPALHPGDVQVVQAVTPPNDSALWDLHNCIVFSQKGSRDLPNMLSGGDLDGDLYNIIYDEDLLPRKAAAPAAYAPAQPVDIGRTVTTDDMTGFFIDFMQNDQLGRIATLHQVFADLDGTSSDRCLLLAELHSTAVDFSKSGVPVDIKRIPRAPAYRPDFMAPTASTKVEKGIKRPEEAAILEGNQRYGYYESDRILGQLYRAVDEDIFFQDLDDDASSLFCREATDDVLKDILEMVSLRLSSKRIDAYQTLAREVRDFYESNMLDIMSLYAVGRNESLTEKEVFIGTIMGRSGAGNKYQRERSDYMKNRFNRDLQDLKSWMKAQTNNDDDSFLSLASACLHVAVKEQSRCGAKLSSFGWFAAGMCVPEIV